MSGFNVELTITVKDNGETFTHTESKYVVPIGVDELYGEDLRHAIVTAYSRFLNYDLADHIADYMKAKRKVEERQVTLEDMKKILENIYAQ